MIDIRIFRQFYSDRSTIGRLEINGHYFCETLEDRIRMKGHKVIGETAIPEGFYNVKLRMSPKTHKLTPWVLDVPNFTNIQIHIGNYPDDTMGCILVGYVRGDDCIYRSKPAFTDLMKRLTKAERITLEII